MTHPLWGIANIFFLQCVTVPSEAHTRDHLKSVVSHILRLSETQRAGDSAKGTKVAHSPSQSTVVPNPRVYTRVSQRKVHKLRITSKG